MNHETIEIIKPGIYTDMNAYWAMHYCSILETLYEHKTIAHGFQKTYMVDVPPTLHNLVANADFSFFRDIKQSLKNFGLQSLLRHYLISSEGAPVFFDIMEKLTDHHNYDLLNNNYEYGVFISCKDFTSGMRFIEENNNPVLLGYEPMLYAEAGKLVTYADLCFLLKNPNGNLAILGEVEGNKGGELLLNSFWSNKKGVYYSFGIGVKKKNRVGVLPEPSYITGKWVDTEHGWKYVIMIESDHSLIDDFHSAIDTMQTLLTMGPRQRGNYEPSLLPVLNLIKQNWNGDIVELISQLRQFLSSNKFASLGTNPLRAKVIPSIVS